MKLLSLLTSVSPSISELLHYSLLRCSLLHVHCTAGSLFPFLVLGTHLQTCLPTSFFCLSKFIASLLESEAKSSEMSKSNAFALREQITQLSSMPSAALHSPTCCTRSQLLFPPVFLVRISIWKTQICRTLMYTEEMFYPACAGKDVWQKTPWWFKSLLLNLIQRCTNCSDLSWDPEISKLPMNKTWG